MPGKRLVKLKQGTVPGVGKGEQYRVRQVLAQEIGISNWDHHVEHSAHHEARLADFAELSEALPGEGFPRTKGGDLGLCNLGARYGFTIAGCVVRVLL